jgi:hypothetical protein
MLTMGYRSFISYRDRDRIFILQDSERGMDGWEKEVFSGEILENPFGVSSI